MDNKFFDDETGETLARDFPSQYYQNINQLVHDLRQSQGGVDANSLVIVMEFDPNNLPSGWDEFVRDVMDRANQSAAGAKLRAIKSEKRSEQSRINGRLGGRPAKTQPTPRALDGGQSPKI